MDLPFGGFTNLASSTAAFIINSPFKLFGSLGSLLSPRALAASTQLTSDPFGITQYGYPAGSISNDPAGYWQQNCTTQDSKDPNLIGGQTTSAWNSSAATPANLDQNTYMPTNNTTDQCLLIESAVGSTGALYDTSLLTPSEQSLATGNGGN